MRFGLCALALLPAAANADIITQPSRATEAVLYPRMGQITHAVTLDLPAGAHQIILPDLPPNLALDSLRISAPGVRLGSIRYRDDLAPPRGDRDTDAIKAAETRINEIEAQIDAVNDEATRQALAAKAAEAQIEFLTSLGQGDLPADVATLRALSQMVGEEALAASEAALQGEQAARKTRDALEDLQDDLKAARAALASLVPEPEDRPYLVLEVSAQDAVQNQPLAVSFLATAWWEPTYDFRLTDGTLTIDRGAQVSQETGENWQDIKLTLSTQQPSEQIAPNDVPQDRRRIFDPEEMQKRARTVTSRQMSADAEPIIEAPVIIEEAAGYAGRAEMQGLAVTYVFDRAVSVASGTDTVRLPFDSQQIEAETFAGAAPFYDETAFLMARFTPDFGQPLLPTGNALHFFEGGLVGSTYFQGLADGEEAELAFGPIDGLQLTRTVLNRNEGDRGLISRRNEMSETVRIEVENLTDRAWPVELRDRVPYSEQEDLQVSFTAAPAPDVTDLDDRRGILQWSLDMAPGARQTIELSHILKWPDGMMLR